MTEHQKKTIGVMAIMARWSDNKYLVIREKTTKPWCDKKTGDLGAPMGSRDGQEAVMALEREIKEETGFTRNDYLLDSQPVGSFYTEKGSVLIYTVLLKSESQDKRIVPLHKDIDCPTWMSLEQIKKVTVRGGVEQAIELFEKGKRNFFAEGKGFHREKGRLPFNTVLVSGKSVEEKEVIW